MDLQMDLLADMTEEQCFQFCDELMELMAGRYVELVPWFKDTLAAVVYTEIGMVPDNPELRLTLAEVEERVSPFVDDPAVLQMYFAVIGKAVEQGKWKRKWRRNTTPPSGWRWPSRILEGAMRKSDLVVTVDLERTVSVSSERVLRKQLNDEEQATVCQASFKPGWFVRSRGIDYLYVWCDECLNWHQHAIEEQEKIAGSVTSRMHHCNCPGDGQIYCLGPADKDLAKQIRRDYRKLRVQQPPAIRRVYVSPT